MKITDAGLAKIEEMAEGVLGDGVKVTACDTKPKATGRDEAIHAAYGEAFAAYAVADAAYAAYVDAYKTATTAWDAVGKIVGETT
jgi:hypothetical protein